MTQKGQDRAPMHLVMSPVSQKQLEMLFSNNC